MLLAQKTVSVLKINERTSVSLMSGSRAVATIPSSFPDAADNGMVNDLLSPGRGVDGFDWILKFSSPGKVFKDVSFANPLTGYIVTELGSVYKTVNGGDSWVSKMNLGFPYYWYGVDAISPDTVVISGFNNQGAINEGVVRWTFNGGSSWTPDITLPIPVSGVGWLDKVHFFNPDTGIVFNSFSGGCWYTFNGGKDSSSWAYIPINPDLGWFAGNIDAEKDGRVYTAGIHFSAGTGFGTAWNSYPPADQVFDGGVDFLDSDSLLGWTGGGQISAPVAGWIHRTTDGGKSWSQRLETFPYPIRAVCFLTASSGIAIGGNLYDEAGGIYSTADSGFTWNLDKNTEAEMFAINYKVISPDSMDFWCVGSTGGGTGFTGRLFKARTSNLVTGIREHGPMGSRQPSLGPAIPNPVRNSASITYFIPETCNTSLKVYDLFGKEVTTLVNGMQGPGFHSIRFEPREMAEGLYYYQLCAGYYIETKKLVFYNQ
jgi:hypothetical protein